MKTLKIDRGDLVLKSGRFEYVEGKDKVGQIVGELLLIEKLENGFGAGIINRLGNITGDDAISLIRDGIRMYKKLQDKSLWYKYMSVDEIIGSIEKLNAWVKKTNVVFELEISNGKNAIIEIVGGV